MMKNNDVKSENIWVQITKQFKNFTLKYIVGGINITHSHGSASVLKATKQVNKKGQNSTPRHTKTP